MLGWLGHSTRLNACRPVVQRALGAARMDGGGAFRSQVVHVAAGSWLRPGGAAPRPRPFLKPAQAITPSAWGFCPGSLVRIPPSDMEVCCHPPLPSIGTGCDGYTLFGTGCDGCTV